LWQVPASRKGHDYYRFIDARVDTGGLGRDPSGPPAGNDPDKLLGTVVRLDDRAAAADATAHHGRRSACTTGDDDEALSTSTTRPTTSAPTRIKRCSWAWRRARVVAARAPRAGTPSIIIEKARILP
jgi:hypothetical protein